MWHPELANEFLNSALFGVATPHPEWRQFGHTPRVLRGAALDWPAVQNWSFFSLAKLAPDLPVELVYGNREHEATCLRQSTWGSHLESFQRLGPENQPVANLKEFDLLSRFPVLLNDLRLGALFPRGAVIANQAWIGPAHARTGLHFDLLRNIALVLIGRKRLYLLPPAALKKHQLSDKYERWARLSNCSVDQVLSEGGDDVASVLQVVDLGPGDALYVPSGWWHEVVNLEPSVLLSGFFGKRAQVWGTWLWTGALHGCHLSGLWRHGHCTCHPAVHRAR